MSAASCRTADVPRRTSLRLRSIMSGFSIRLSPNSGTRPTALPGEGATRQHTCWVRAPDSTYNSACADYVYSDPFPSFPFSVL
ncbi:MAG: hypothetical protein GF315_12370 [candidate division Zixibacteria bacterium]|nr:hypothetical protein [candidate division Zixibacteria bacterium]